MKTNNLKDFKLFETFHISHMVYLIYQKEIYHKMTKLKNLTLLLNDLDRLYSKYDVLYKCFIETDGSLYTDDELVSMFVNRKDPDMLFKIKEMRDNLYEHKIWIEEEIDELIK